MADERSHLLSLLLDQFAHHQEKISVFAGDGTNIVLARQILTLFSPYISSLLATIPPCHTTALIAPEFSASALSSIGDILENGFTTTNSVDVQTEVIDVAKALHIHMLNLESIDDSISNNEIMDMLGEKVIEEQNSTPNEQETSNKHSESEATRDMTNDEANTDVPDEEKLLEECGDNIIQIENSFSLAGANFEFGVMEEEVITLGDAESNNVENETEMKTDDQTQHKCKLCNEQVDSLEALLYHYCFHFEQELLLKAAFLSEGKTCIQCKRTFEELDSVFILHFGLFHSKIIDILKEKNIGNFEISRQNKETENKEVENKELETRNWRLREEVEKVDKIPKRTLSDKPHNVRRRIESTGRRNRMPTVSRRKPVDDPARKLRVANAYDYLLSSGVGTKVNRAEDETKIVENNIEKKVETTFAKKEVETVVIDDEDEDMNLVDKLMQSTEFLINSDPVRSLEHTLALLDDDRGSITPSPTPSLVSNTPSEVICQICGKDVQIYSRLMPHYHGHLASHVKKKFSDLMVFSDDSFKCKVCGNNSKTEMSLVSHISMTHDKLNEILMERGIEPVVKKHQKTSRKGWDIPTQIL